WRPARPAADRRFPWSGNEEVCLYPPFFAPRSDLRLESATANSCFSHFTTRAEHHQVGWRTLFHHAVAVQACYPRWVYRCQPKGLLQVPLGILHHIADSTIHGENASRQLAANEGLPIFHLYFTRSETISACRHSLRSRCIGNQDCSIGPFSFQEQVHHSGVDVNTVGNNVGRNPRVGQHFGQDPWVPV